MKLNQLEKIENKIRSTTLLTIKPEILKYLEGSNFWLIGNKFYYEDILKAKLEMERPKRPIRNERN